MDEDKLGLVLMSPGRAALAAPSCGPRRLSSRLYNLFNDLCDLHNRLFDLLFANRRCDVIRRNPRDLSVAHTLR